MVLHRLLTLVAPKHRSDDAAQIEIFALRHQLQVLHRQVKRPVYRHGDRALLAAASRIRVTRTPIRAPNANAFAERSMETARAECLDWLLILGPRHLDRILRIYVQHYNRRRLHRGLELQVPESLAPVEEADGVPDIERRDLLGGFVHEYMRAA